MKKIILLIILSFVTCFFNAQVSGYGFTQFSDTYVAITGGTVFGATTSDDERFVDPSVPLGGGGTTGVGIPIGFNFTYNGNVFDRIAINTNGWISLGQSTLTPNPVNINSSSSYNVISATSSAPAILQNRIAALARDLEGQTGSEIRVETIGASPNQTLVVQWSNFRRFGGTGDNYNFQIRLTETVNKVNIIYGTFVSGAASTAQVGLRGAANTDFNNRNVATTNLWATSIAGTINSAVVNFNTTLAPISGQNYEWTGPVPCSGTPNSGIATISSSVGCSNTPFNLNATGLSNGLGITYQWYSAPTASGPWVSIPTGTTTAFTNSASTITFYQLETTCTVSASSATSSVVSYTPSNCFTMSNATITTCSGTVYDSGGSSANYQSNEDYTLTIVPSTSGAMAQLNFINFGVETCCDYLQIYDGNSTSAALIGQYNALPPAITATNASGALTLRFFSDGSVVNTGFEATISCFITTNCSGTPNSGTASISSSVGCSNNPFNLNATGLSNGNGLTYQWYSAPTATGPWVSIPTATNPAFTYSSSAITFYQLETTCTVSALSATTSVVSFTPTNCFTMSNTTITTCSGTVYDSGGPSANYQNSEDYTLTIVPSTSGAMAQLNFINFSVETCCDYLQIYDGNSTSAALIGQYTALPPAITATNASGALTLRFFSDGSVTNPGFEATISCFIPPACSGAPNSGVAAISSATACLSTGVILSGTGVTTGLGINYQWYSAPTASGPWTSIPNATLAVISQTAANITFYQLETTCTVSALSATSSVISYTPSNCFTMSNTTITTCSGTLYDSGGPNADYQNNENYTLTIVPSTSGAMAQLNFINFSVETCCDYLQIYDGNSTSAALIGQYTALPPAITATNASGALTLRFYSDGSVTNPGFEATISCFIPPTCSGTPNSGVAAISSATACLNTGVVLSGTGITTGLGINYQWYSAPTASGPWTSIPNATLAVISQTAANITFYQLETTCTVSALSATSSIVSYTPSNCYTMSNTTITTCSSTLYDSGGPNVNYQNNEDYTLTIVPSTANASVTLTFINFSTEASFDELEVYDGGNTSAPLIGTYSGNSLPPTITASNTAGELTLRFSSDTSVDDIGYEIALSCSLACSGPPSTIIATATTICAGNQAVLNTVATGTAQWYSSSTATAYIATGNAFTTPVLNITTTYYVVDSTNCGLSLKTPVTVSVIPTPTLLVVSSNTAVCEGSSATLTASGVDSYTWSTAANTAVIIVSPTISTTYTVEGFSSACSITQTASVLLGVNPNPSVTLSSGGISTICVTNGSIALTGSPSGGVYSGIGVTGNLLSIANGGTFTPVYSYTNPSTGCFASATTTVVVSVCNSVIELSKNAGISIYPNPNYGLFTIETGTDVFKTIEVLDLTGRVLSSKTSDARTIDVDIQLLANGVYYVKVKSDIGFDLIKIVKQ